MDDAEDFLICQRHHTDSAELGVPQSVLQHGQAQFGQHVANVDAVTTSLIDEIGANLGASR